MMKAHCIFLISFFLALLAICRAHLTNDSTPDHPMKNEQQIILDKDEQSGKDIYYKKMAITSELSLRRNAQVDMCGQACYSNEFCRVDPTCDWCGEYFL